MKTLQTILLMFAVTTLISCTEQKSLFALKKEMLTETQKLEKNILILQKTITNHQSQTEVSKQYQNTKLQFKKVEWAMTCLLPEMLDSEESLVESDGQSIYFAKKDFTNLDQIISNDINQVDKKLLLLQIDNLLDANRNTIAYLESIDMENTELFANK